MVRSVKNGMLTTRGRKNEKERTPEKEKGPAVTGPPRDTAAKGPGFGPHTTSCGDSAAQIEGRNASCSPRGVREALGMHSLCLKGPSFG